MIVRLVEAVFIAVAASTIGTVLAKKLGHTINKHFEHEETLDKEEHAEGQDHSVLR